MDAVSTENNPSQALQEEASIQPLEKGVARVKNILQRHLGTERAAELIPPEKTIVEITQENFRWRYRYYEGPNDKNPNDGEIYSIKFQDGSAAFFTYSKVPVDDMWRAIMLNAQAVSAGVRVHEWAVNNSAIWNGKDSLELVIPVAEPTAQGSVVDKYTAVYDGTKTNFTILNSKGETKTQVLDGDQTNPELILTEWRPLIGRDGQSLETIKYRNPSAATTFASPTDVV